MAKKSYKVCGLADAKGGSDVTVMVKAATPDLAIEEAAKKDASLKNHKDVRVYQQAGWTRVK